mgnify:CR=1 FL=1
MTRKRYIKLLMSVGVQRNEAEELAAFERKREKAYKDFRGPFAELNVACLRFLMGFYKFLDIIVKELPQ